MTTYRVTFEITPPVPATEKQIEEWVKFHIGASDQLNGDNPLVDYDLEGRYVYVN